MKTKPSVGFDAYFLEHPMTGMGQYALRLWNELCKRDDLDARLLHPADAPQQVVQLAGDRGVAVAVPGGGRLPAKVRKVWWEQRGVVIGAKRAGADLVHVPYFAAPLRKPVPFIVTIHDAIPMVFREYTGGRITRAYLRFVSKAARGAALVLTDSAHAAGDIREHLNIPPERIVPILLAAGEEFTPATGDSDFVRIGAMRAKLGLERPFVLNVGGFDLRKNLTSLIDGFAMAVPDLVEPVDLVIVGSPHSANRELFPDVRPLIEQLGLRDRIKLTGFVSEQDKLDLYRAASVFAFTSLYEGFGLNPLEAMACGTPVISSNRSSLPEVVGDGGLTIDPVPAEIAAALVTVLNDQTLRSDLQKRGLEQAATMSWSKTASQTIEAYYRVLS